LKTTGILVTMLSVETDTEAARQELERILRSAGFVHNERLSRFLRFVVERHLEGKGHELKESVIAVEVLGRPADYNPKQDAVVRIEAGRLRARLSEFYIGEGKDDPLVIQLPKGGYAPSFRHREVANQTTRQGTKTRSMGWILGAITGLGVALGVIGWWRVQLTSGPITIAVLPLENLSRDPANDYFADGLTDEIIRNLSIIEGLAVRSQTSSFAFKGKPRSVHETGRQLDVDYLLEGSVLRVDERLRIDAQLIRVRDDVPLWSNRFDRDLTDVFAIQDEISRGIVNNLRLKLGAGRRRYETSVEAYDLYLRARAFQLSPGGTQVIALFEQAISKDPAFAPAYAGLGAAYSYRSVQFPLDHPSDELEKMRAASEKAIQLDPLLAEAHSALARAYARDSQWQESERSFHHAIDLDRNRSRTYREYAMWLLRPLGRKSEALQWLKVAQRTDPLSTDIPGYLADILISLGRYDEAAELCLKADPANGQTKEWLARSRWGQGRIDEPIRLLSDLAAGRSQSRGFLGFMYARSGRREEAEKMAAASMYANEQALIYAGLGDKDRTFEALDRMAELGAQRVGVYINYPELAFLREDPRLKVLQKKVGLPVE
jgi:TolB-like protein/Tfp pilus assembly protein PilF